jgi:hypothetical protein
MDSTFQDSPTIGRTVRYTANSPLPTRPNAASSRYEVQVFRSFLLHNPGPTPLIGLSSFRFHTFPCFQIAGLCLGRIRAWSLQSVLPRRRCPKADARWEPRESIRGIPYLLHDPPRPRRALRALPEHRFPRCLAGVFLPGIYAVVQRPTRAFDRGVHSTDPIALSALGRDGYPQAHSLQTRPFPTLLLPLSHAS